MRPKIKQPGSKHPTKEEISEPVSVVLIYSFGKLHLVLSERLWTVVFVVRLVSEVLSELFDVLDLLGPRWNWRLLWLVSHAA